MAEVTLTNCDEEPIHIPGAIQPHGALLAFRRADGVVTHASANLGDRVGVEVGDVLGQPLTDRLLAGGAGITKALASLAGPTSRRLVEVGGPSSPLEGVVTGYEDTHGILEVMEPRSQDDVGLRTFYANLMDSVADLQRIGEPDGLLSAIGTATQRLTGYDRVMVYRFSPEWHGQVVAEERRPDLEPFLGLHYPATDIPAQARRLYELQWVRVIGDVGYEAVEIASSEGEGPLDLSLTRLRSVSPIHIEYLKNMGVGATLTVSLLQEGKLWGLIACHHYSPYLPAPEIQTACELLGQVFSSQLLHAERIRVAGRSRVVNDVVRAVFDEAVTSGSWEETVATHLNRLRTAFDAGGVALAAPEKAYTAGSTPSRNATQYIARALGTWAEDREGEILVTDHADRHSSEVTDGLDASQREVAAGLIAIPLAFPADTWFMLFRPEVAKEVDWAGDPRKHVVRSDDGARLSPRKSFEKWTEVVEGRSRAWEEWQIRGAHYLQEAFGRTVVRRAREVAALNARLEASNVELDAFAHSAAHDLKAPLRGIRNLARILLEDDPPPEERQEVLRRVERLTHRMDLVIQSLLDYARIGHTELERADVAFGEIVADVLEDLAADIVATGAVVEVDPDLPTVPCDPGRVGQAVQNLLANALKYSREGEVPRIHVGANVRPHHPTEFFVADQGIGIPAEFRERVFDLFRRLHGASDFGGGSGAGLAIVRRIVQRHGGWIRVEESPSGGALFRFTLQPDFPDSL